jgi:NAD(P)-dependent dehydrogenase (short-subunit alcohol dehydrogenase family)
MRPLEEQTILITGATDGLGKGLAIELAGMGSELLLHGRDDAKGREAIEEIRERTGNDKLRWYRADLASLAEVRELAARVERDHDRLDVLVNNAGILGRRKPVPEMTADDLRLVFDTNVFGIVRVTRAFLALLERSAHPVIVNVSSGMGSLAVTTDRSRFESTLISLAYPASKAAVNMLTTQYAKAFPQMRINAVDPGYTATDFNDHRGTKPVEQGAEAIVRMAKLNGSGPTGTFVDEDGVVPW